MELFDTFVLDDAGSRQTRDGYLVVAARAARTGIQVYHGSEVGRPDMPLVRVFRPEAEVFAGDAMASFAHRPLTSDHPSKLVTAKTWRDHAVGFTGGDVARDGDFLRIPLLLADADAIKDVRAGKRELSAGYTCELDFTPGKTPDGDTYDAMQVAIRANHIAIVDTGRAGPECRIGDQHPQPPKGPDMPDNLRAVMVDGISIQTTDQGAQAIERLQRLLDEAKTSNASLNNQHSTALDAMRVDHERALNGLNGQIAALRTETTRVTEAKDGEIAGLRAAHQMELEAKDGEIAGLRSNIPDGATLDALIEQRQAVVAAARRILGDSFDAAGKNDMDIRRMVVAQKLGEEIAGRGDAYIGPAFDGIVGAIGSVAQAKDPIRDHMRAQPATRTPGPTTLADAAAARAEMIARMQNAWIGNNEKGAA
jgi:hypothetical protein